MYGIGGFAFPLLSATLYDLVGWNWTMNIMGAMSLSFFVVYFSVCNGFGAFSQTRKNYLGRNARTDPFDKLIDAVTPLRNSKMGFGSLLSSHHKAAFSQYSEAVT